MASRKLVTRKAVIPAPKRFIVIPLLYNKNLQKRPDLIAPLVDNIFLSHECTEFENDGESVRDADSLSSVIIRRPTPNTLTPSFNTQAPSGVLFSSEVRFNAWKFHSSNNNITYRRLIDLQKVPKTPSFMSISRNT